MNAEIKKELESIGLDKTYPVLWLINGLEYAKGKMGHLCICGYSKHLAFIDEGKNSIKPLVVSDISINDGGCLDATWCLDTQCKYNKTTGKSYAQNYHLSEEDTKMTVEGWDQMIENFQNINDILSEDLDLMDFSKTNIMQGPGPLVEWVKLQP